VKVQETLNAAESFKVYFSIFVGPVETQSSQDPIRDVIVAILSNLRELQQAPQWKSITLAYSCQFLLQSR